MNGCDLTLHLCIWNSTEIVCCIGILRNGDTCLIIFAGNCFPVCIFCIPIRVILYIIYCILIVVYTGYGLSAAYRKYDIFICPGIVCINLSACSSGKYIRRSCNFVIQNNSNSIVFHCICHSCCVVPGVVQYSYINFSLKTFWIVCGRNYNCAFSLWFPFSILKGSVLGYQLILVLLDTTVYFCSVFFFTFIGCLNLNGDFILENQSKAKSIRYIFDESFIFFQLIRHGNVLRSSIVYLHFNSHRRRHIFASVYCTNIIGAIEFFIRQGNRESAIRFNINTIFTVKGISGKFFTSLDFRILNSDFSDIMTIIRYISHDFHRIVACMRPSNIWKSRNLRRLIIDISNLNCRFCKKLSVFIDSLDCIISLFLYQEFLVVIGLFSTFTSHSTVGRSLYIHFFVMLQIFCIICDFHCKAADRFKHCIFIFIHRCNLITIHRLIANSKICTAFIHFCGFYDIVGRSCLGQPYLIDSAYKIAFIALILDCKCNFWFSIYSYNCIHRNLRCIHINFQRIRLRKNIWNNTVCCHITEVIVSTRQLANFTALLTWCYARSVFSDIISSYFLVFIWRNICIV